MTETIDTLIVGAGPAGLSLSYYLTQQNKPHLLLEAASRLAEPWRSQRWDSFTLVTPNWMIRLPGCEYQGSDPDGYLPRDEVAAYLEDYAASFQAPVRLNERAAALHSEDGGYRVQTNAGEYRANNVVIATGAFQKPRIPAYSAGLPGSVNQIHSGQYRNPEQLPPGAVLVAGSAQSGCQIAEELYQSGRKVYLATGASSGRVPRRYRGKDITYWLGQIGFFDRTVDTLESPRDRSRGNPQASGKGGGHTINLHQFARDGVTLLGRIAGAADGRALFAPDLKENLAKMDGFEREVIRQTDQYIAKNRIDAPEETLPALSDGYQAESITELDLQQAGITSVVWALGLRSDFSWVDLPVTDGDGFPVQKRGVSAFPGLYFMGMQWQYKGKSNILYGFGEDAAYLAAQVK